MLGPPEVAQYLPPGPTTRAEFETFIAWAQQTHQAGRCISFAVVPRDIEAAVGIFQIWPLQPDFGVAEWGFALGRPFWGTGLFFECAPLVIDFAVEALGVRRLESRAAADDPRGNGALRKIGAVREMVMRKCFPCTDGEYRDHVMWSIMADAWKPLSTDPHAAEQARSGSWALMPVRGTQQGPSVGPRRSRGRLGLGAPSNRASAAPEVNAPPATLSFESWVVFQDTE